MPSAPGERCRTGRSRRRPPWLARETLEAVKDIWRTTSNVGIACAPWKNAGVGVGIPIRAASWWSRDGKSSHILLRRPHRTGDSAWARRSSAPCCGLRADGMSSTGPQHGERADSGTTSGSRQTLVTGTCQRACQDAARGGEASVRLFGIAHLKGMESLPGGRRHSRHRCLRGRRGLECSRDKGSGKYLAKTDPLGRDVANPVSHVAYGYATQVCVLNDDGTIREIDAAHFVGKAINPLSCEGADRGRRHHALRLHADGHYRSTTASPAQRFGTLGLFPRRSRCRPSTAFWWRRRGRTWPSAPSASARSRPSRRLPPWRARTSRSTARCAPAFR